MEETIGEVTDRAGLLEKDKQAAGGQTKAGEDGGAQSDSKEDRDVILLKKRITANLES